MNPISHPFMVSDIPKPRILDEANAGLGHIAEGGRGFVAYRTVTNVPLCVTIDRSEESKDGATMEAAMRALALAFGWSAQDWTAGGIKTTTFTPPEGRE